MKTEAQYSAEQKLLLALLGRRRDRATMRSLLRQVNWQKFLSTTSEDLYPYLAFALERYSNFREEAPAEWERLLRARHLTAVHNLLLRHELGKVLQALRLRGIPALALKGVVLAYTAYPDPSLRPMSDLDVLVPPRKKERALMVLHDLGYEYPEAMRSVPLHRSLVVRRGQNHEFAPPLRLRASTVLLDVHTELECSEPMFPISARELWSRSIVVDLKGLRVRTLFSEDLLFHVCLHLSRAHRFEKGLLPLIDLNVLLDSRSDWNWARIAERSLRCGFATWMYLTLAAARELMGASVPESFFDAIPSPRDLTRLSCLVEEQIWLAQGSLRRIPLFLHSFLAERSWQKRLRMCVARMRIVGRDELGSERAIFRLAEGARLFLRRLLSTLRTRIPSYIDAWKEGNLQIRSIRRWAILWQRSDTLFELAEQETQSADHEDKDSLPETTLPSQTG